MLFADLIPEVLPEVPGCPDFTVRRAIRDSAIEFFDQTLAYTVDQDPEPVFAGLETVDLAIPPGTRLVQVLRAQIGPNQLDRIAREDLFASGVDWRTERGTPQGITLETETSVRVVPVADADSILPLYIRFAVTPTRMSTSMPDALGERFYNEIVAGAKSRLMLMPQRSWSDTKTGVGYRGIYERGIREAKLTVAQDSVSGRRQVRLRRVV